MTPVQNYIHDFEALHTWFMAQNCVQWNLYRGFHDRMPERMIIHRQQNGEIDLEESFRLLKEMIDMNGTGGGKFTIWVPAYGTRKGPSIWFGMNLHPFSQSAARVAGVGGGAPSVGYVPADEVDRRIAAALSQQKLEREVQDLKDALEHKSDWQEILMGKLSELDPNQIVQTLSGFLGKAMGTPNVPVQLRGVQPQATPPTAPQEPAEEDGFIYDEDRLLPILDVIRQHYPDSDTFLNDLEKLAARFDQQPDFFKQMLG